MGFSTEIDHIFQSNSTQDPHQVCCLFKFHIVCVEWLCKFAVIDDQVGVSLDIGYQESGWLGLLVPFLDGIVGITMFLGILNLFDNNACSWEKV